MKKLLFIFFIPFVLTQASIAEAMTFRVKKIDMRLFDLIYYIYAIGDVEKGDSDRLLTAIREQNIPRGTRLEIYFNSLGGSLAAGLELGRSISALSTIGLSANTNVGSETANPLNPAEGECSSACVFAYLGGEYRHLNQKSRLGVHQFFMGGDKAIDPATALSAGQIISAEIVEFVRKTGADVSIFKIMASVAPGEIFYVPHEKLRELRVIIETVMDEAWTFELLDGLTYLKIWQLSRYGENKMLLSCINGQLTGVAFVQPPQNHTVGMLPHTVGVFVDGNLETIPSHRIVSPPAFQGKFVNAFFSVDQNLAIRMLTARSVGVAIQPPNRDIFIGFQIDTAKGKDKLASMIGSCARKPAATSTSAASAPVSPLADAPPTSGRTFPLPARFNDYRVAMDFRGPNAAPILDTREKSAYRTRLRAAARCERPPAKAGGFGLRLEAGSCRPYGPTGARRS